MGKHSGGSFKSSSSSSSSFGSHHRGGSHYGGHHHHYGGHHHHYGGHHHYHGGYNHYNNTGATFRCSPFSCFVFTVIAVILAIFVVGMLIAPWTKNNEVDLGLLETYIFRPSTTWNREIRLSSESVGFVTAYKFARMPPIDPERKSKSEHQEFSVYYNNFDSQAYYLIKDSLITVNFTATKSLDFFVLKGASQFASWRNGDDVSYLYQTYNSVLNSRTFTMTTTDDIYLIWRNTLVHSEIEVDAHILIEMVSYDLSNPLETCDFNSTSCVFPLTKGSTEVVAIAAGLSDDQNLQFGVKYTINGRMSYYFAIFGGVLGACVVFGFFVFLLGVFIRRRRSTYSSM